MENVKKSKLINVLIPFGIALFIAGIVISFYRAENLSLEILFLIFAGIQFVLALLILLLSIKVSHKATQLFMGMVLLAWAVLHIILSFLLPFTLLEFWPVYAAVAGILLFVSGFYKYKKILFGYVIPSLVLTGMGIWYSFFSFDVIKTPFLEVVKKLFPGFAIFMAGLLVGLFFAQKRNKKLVLSDENTGTFSDEEEMENV